MRDAPWAEDEGLGPPFDIVEPRELAAPLVLNSPHSGAKYPPRFLAQSRLDPLTLRKSEDAFVDELAAPSVAVGAPLLRAHFPRAYLDVNREPYELDPQMFEGRLPSYANTRSLRVAAGLGSIPRVVGEAQPIYRQPLKLQEGLDRIASLHAPYHAALESLVERARQTYGFSILIDFHSMPSSTPDVAGCDIVLGDRFGSSAAGWIVERLDASLRASGLTVRRNKPYAGGFITEVYGRPAQGRHAVQIEVNRALYMDERTIRRLPNAKTLAEALRRAIEAVVDRAASQRISRLAAE
jgi:N-formylglutamate amidohydrolase